MRRAAAGAAWLLLIVACGGDDGSADLDVAERELADAIADQFLDETRTLPVGEDEADCFAERTVETLGVERLDELGLDTAAVRGGTGPADVALSEPDIEVMTDAFVDCIDFGRAFVDVLLEGTDGGVSEESASCVAGGFSEETIRGAARAGITGERFDPDEDPELLAELFGLFNGCLTPEELVALAG